MKINVSSVAQKDPTENFTAKSINNIILAYYTTYTIGFYELYILRKPNEMLAWYISLHNDIFGLKITLETLKLISKNV